MIKWKSLRCVGAPWPPSVGLCGMRASLGRRLCDVCPPLPSWHARCYRPLASHLHRSPRPGRPGRHHLCNAALDVASTVRRSTVLSERDNYIGVEVWRPLLLQGDWERPQRVSLPPWGGVCVTDEDRVQEILTYVPKSLEIDNNVRYNGLYRVDAVRKGKGPRRVGHPCSVTHKERSCHVYHSHAFGSAGI